MIFFAIAGYSNVRFIWQSKLVLLVIYTGKERP